MIINSDTIEQLSFEHGAVKRCLIEEYFGVWAIESSRFDKMCDIVRGKDLTQHIHVSKDAVQEVVARHDDRPYTLEQGVAIIDCRGAIMKYSSSFSSNASTLRMRRQLSAALNDDDVKAILIVYDTPGGTVAGTKDLADAIARAKKQKPVYGFVEDLCASAGYWLGSQSGKLWAANTTNLVGSIGTYSVIYDFSENAKQNGIKTIVIKDGDFKGTGVPGTEISESQVQELTRIVKQLNTEFKKGVASGRNVALEVVNQWADGRVHVANDAKEMNLIDGVGTLEEFFQLIQTDIKGATMKTATKSETSGEEKKPLTVSQLKSLCTKADSDWYLSQVESGVDREEALANYSLFLEEKAEAAEKAASEAQSKLENSAGLGETDEEKPGDEPLGKSGKDVNATGDDGAQKFIGLVNSIMDKNPKIDQAQAVVAAQKKDPAAHRAYVISSQRNKKRRKNATAKFQDIDDMNED